MSKDVHITHIEKAFTDFYSDADKSQMGILTAGLTYHEMVWKNQANNRVYVGAIQKYYNGSWAYCDNEFKSVTLYNSAYAMKLQASSSQSEAITLTFPVVNADTSGKALVFTTGGTGSWSSFIFNTSGMYIGTNASAATIPIYTTVTQDGTTQIRVRNDSNTAAGKSSFGAYYSTTQFIQVAQNSPSFSSSGLRVANSCAVYSTGNTAGLRVFTTDASDLILGTDGDARLTIQNTTGWAGINITAPLTRFHIVSATAFTDATTQAGQDTLYLQNTAGAGINAVGASIGFCGIDRVNRLAAFGCIQTTSDADQIGFVWYTHASATTDDAMVESMRLDHQGWLGVGIAPECALTVHALTSGTTDTVEVVRFRRHTNGTAGNDLAGSLKLYTEDEYGTDLYCGGLRWGMRGLTGTSIGGAQNQKGNIALVTQSDKTATQSITISIPDDGVANVTDLFEGAVTGNCIMFIQIHGQMLGASVQWANSNPISLTGSNSFSMSDVDGKFCLIGDTWPALGTIKNRLGSTMVATLTAVGNYS